MTPNTGTFSPSQVVEIAAALGVEGEVDLQQLRVGMEVELEHGRRDPITNVTDDDPLLTAKIALAHLRELPDYYVRLEAMEADEARPAPPRVTVAELMSTPPITVSQDAPMSAADRILDDSHVSGLAVVDSAGALVGVVSRTDILRLSAHTPISAWPGMRVSGAMTSPALTIETTATLPEAADRLEAHGVHRLVVVDQAGAAIGMFSTTDLVRAVAARRG